MSRSRRALTRAGVAFEEAHPIGDPGEKIAAYAHEGRFGLVILGTHGRGAAASLLLGSVTQKVIGGCRVPVLVVR